MNIPYRQVHIDFHISPDIPDVGSAFDPDEFIETLQLAHINSANIFAKCHHGMYYYPTGIGKQHPGLKGFDLFGAELAACRRADIRAIAYTCVAWNEQTASEHPEWLVLHADGQRGCKKPFSQGYTSWNTLCISRKEYRDLLKREFREIWDLYHPDGFWIDIVNGYQCVCPCCRAEMREAGLDPENPADVMVHDRMTEINFCREFYDYLKSMDRSMEIYFNNMPYALDDASDGRVSSAEKRKYFDFIDIESLPSEDWGYDHFPIAASYVNKYDTPLTMMNGKFHMSWGDFGSIRNQAALEYECFRALSYGTGCNIGDQMHPLGRLDRNVYRQIGKVYEQVEAKEPWCIDTRPVSDVGVFIATGPGGRPEEPALIENGVYRVLAELHIPFRFLNSRDSFDDCSLLILPDNYVPDQIMIRRLNQFTADGGKLLLTGCSGFDPKTGEPLLDSMPAHLTGKSPYSVRYLRLDPQYFPDILPIDHVLYEHGYTAALPVYDKSAKEPGETVRTLAKIVDPYFERTYMHFCSHRQTPPSPALTKEAGILQSRSCILITSPLFSDYMTNGYRNHREIIGRCIALLRGRPLLVTDLPSISEVTLRQTQSSFVVHILNYVCQKKSRKLETVENKYYVPESSLSLRTEKCPETVRLVPEMKELPFTFDKGYTSFRPGPISGHTMIEIVL